MEVTMTAERKLQRVTVTLMRNKKFALFADLLTVGHVYVDDKLATAKTDGRDEWYGREFVNKLDEKEVAFVRLHETSHKMFRHLTIWAKLYKLDAKLANMACDYVINLPIQDRYYKDQFVKLPDGGCVDEKYRDMDAGEVFKLLKQDNKQSKPKGFDQHDWDGAAKLTDEQADELSKAVDQALRQGNIFASKAGANVDRNILEMLKPKVDWREVLRDFITNCKPGDDYTSYRRIDRRFMSQDVMAPTSYSDSVFRVVLGADTSGSIDNKVLATFLAEVQGVCETTKPELVDLLYWGHNVAAHEIYEADLVSTLHQSTRPKGGGGTEPSCVTRYMREQRIVPDCIVMLTDGDVFGDWGSDWPAPVLWCINNKQIVAPHGVTVHI